MSLYIYSHSLPSSSQLWGRTRNDRPSRVRGNRHPNVVSADRPAPWVAGRKLCTSVFCCTACLLQHLLCADPSGKSNLLDSLLFRAVCVSLYDTALETAFSKTLQSIFPASEVGQRLGIESVHLRANVSPPPLVRERNVKSGLTRGRTLEQSAVSSLLGDWW